ADLVARRQRPEYGGFLGGPQIIDVSRQGRSAKGRIGVILHRAFLDVGIVRIVPRIADPAEGAIQWLRAHTVLCQLVTASLRRVRVRNRRLDREEDQRKRDRRSGRTHMMTSPVYSADWQLGAVGLYSILVRSSNRHPLHDPVDFGGLAQADSFTRGGLC